MEGVFKHTETLQAPYIQHGMFRWDGWKRLGKHQRIPHSGLESNAYGSENSNRPDVEAMLRSRRAAALDASERMGMTGAGSLDEENTTAIPNTSNFGATILEEVPAEQTLTVDQLLGQWTTLKI